MAVFFLFTPGFLVFFGSIMASRTGLHCATVCYLFLLPFLVLWPISEVLYRSLEGVYVLFQPGLMHMLIFPVNICGKTMPCLRLRTLESFRLEKILKAIKSNMSWFDIAPRALAAAWIYP